MNILMVNHYALSPNMAGGTRHFDFAKVLVQRGHRVTIVASSFHHARHEEMRQYVDGNFVEEMIEDVRFIWVKTPGYTGNGLKRVVNMLSFMTHVRSINEDETYDVVIGSSVHLFAVWSAYKLAKKMEACFVMEVRDIWPQTLIDMGMSRWHPFIVINAYLERFLYRRAQKIITLLPQADQHIRQFGVETEDIVWISNGVDPQPYEQMGEVEKKLDFTVTYTGSMGQANALHTLIGVAERLKHEPITFQLVGDGVLKQHFLELKKAKGLDRLLILPSVRKSEIPRLLKESHVLYLGLKDSPLYRFGMSLNKLFDYLAAEVPIVFAASLPSNPVNDAKAGLVIPPEDADKLEETILKLFHMSQSERDVYSRGNLNFIQQNFSIQSLVDKLEKLLNGLLCKKN